MKLCPRRKTDEEYIECIRKRLARSKWYGMLNTGLAVLFFAVFWKLCHSMFSYSNTQVDPVAFVIGIVLGTLAGIMLASGINSFCTMLWAIGEQRTDRLLVQLHDELKQYKENPGRPDNQ